MALVQAVPADEIDDELEAELLASLPADERDEHLARRQAEQEERRRAQIRAANAAPLARRRPGDPRSTAEAAERVRPVALAREQLLPVVPALAELLPDAGLARGSMITVGATGGGGATALALALAAAPSAAGSWVAAVGLPQVGLAAAAEHGLALERFAVVRTPPDDQWATVVAALVGAFDVVLLGPAPAARLGEARRLATRARERGSVLVTIDPAGRSLLEVDLRLTVVGSDWLGSPGPRPPRHSGTRTASGPSRPCTRARARVARRSASVSPPQNPSWRPRAGTTSSGTSRSSVSPLVGSTESSTACRDSSPGSSVLKAPPPGFRQAEPSEREVRCSQPSSCQRTRSVMAPAVNVPS